MVTETINDAALQASGPAARTARKPCITIVALGLVRARRLARRDRRAALQKATAEDRPGKLLSHAKSVLE
eukprot:1620608-Pyramimonas_sp.AAC.1